MGKSPKPWHSAAACSLQVGEEAEEEEEEGAFLEADEDYLPDSSFYVTTTRSGRSALARNKNNQLLRDHGFDLLGQSFGIPSRIDYERGKHSNTSAPKGATGRAASSLPRRYRGLLLDDEVAPAKESNASRRHRAASTSAPAKTPRLVSVAYGTATAGLIHSETDKPPETRGTHTPPSKASLTHRKHIPTEKYVSSGSDDSEAMSPRGISPSMQHYLPPAPPAPPQSLQSHPSSQSATGPYFPFSTAKTTISGNGNDGHTANGGHVFPQCCGRAHPQTEAYANPVQGHTAMANYAVPQTASLHSIPHKQAGLTPAPKLHSAFVLGFVVPPPPPPPLLPGTSAGPAGAVKTTAPEPKKALANDDWQWPSKGESTRTARPSGAADKHKALGHKEDRKRVSDIVLSEPGVSRHTHVCAACGKPRSRGYHMTHVVKKGEQPEPGYCRRCVAHADYTDSETSVRGTGRSFGVKNFPSSGLSTDEDFLISSGRYVHDERSRRHKLHQKPRRSSFLKGFLPNSVRSKSSGRAPGSLSSAEEASSRASSLLQEPRVHGKIALRRAARRRKAAHLRVHPEPEMQTQESSSKSPMEPLGPTETSRSPMMPRVTASQHPTTASPACTQRCVPESPKYHKPIVGEEDPEHDLRDAAGKSVKGDDRSKASSRQSEQGHSACHTSSTSEHAAESRVQKDSQTRETKGDTTKRAGSASRCHAQTRSQVAEARPKKDGRRTFEYIPPTPVDWVPVDYGAQPRIADSDGAWGDAFSEAEEMAAMLAEEELLQAGKRSGLFGGSWGGSATSSIPKSSLLTPSLISIESCSSDEVRTDGNGHYEMAEAEADGTETEGCEETGVSGSQKRQPKQLEFSSHDDQASKTSSRRKSSRRRHDGGSESKMLVPLTARTPASSSMRGVRKSEGRSSLSSHSSDFPPPGEDSSILAHTGHSMEDISCAKNTAPNAVTTTERTPFRELRRLGGFFRSP